MKLSKVRVGVALGLTAGLFAFVIGLLALILDLGWAHAYVIGAVSSGYAGYSATFAGSILGFLWGFAHYFVFGYLLALLYNVIGKFDCCK